MWGVTCCHSGSCRQKVHIKPMGMCGLGGHLPGIWSMAVTEALSLWPSEDVLAPWSPRLSTGSEIPCLALCPHTSSLPSSCFGDPVLFSSTIWIHMDEEGVHTSPPSSLCPPFLRQAPPDPPAVCRPRAKQRGHKKERIGPCAGC